MKTKWICSKCTLYTTMHVNKIIYGDIREEESWLKRDM